jgi:SprT protein
MLHIFHHRVEDELARCLAIVNHEFDKQWYLPTVVYDVFNKTSGFVNPEESEKFIIHLNPILLIDNPEEMINVTCGHEFAHLIDFNTGPINSRRYHGPAWKSIMQMIGVDDSIKHDMDTLNVLTRFTRYLYSCPQCNKHFEVSPKHHRQLQANSKMSFRLNDCFHRFYGANFYLTIPPNSIHYNNSMI